jgi:glycosyltransferase involved in cell wall biosynthesis
VVDDPENQVLARERLTILGMGRLARQKGFDILIEAFARLAHRHPCWDLVIYGEGPERRALERMRDEYGLGERVAMPGLIADPREAFRRSDLFVLPSRYEGFPNALLEAMASGLPVVASRCPSGPAEIIEDARTGLLVPPEDPSALAAAIEKLMLDEKLRFSLGAAAREVREKYSTDRIVECWSRALAEALG